MLGAVVSNLLGALTSVVQNEVALLKNVEGDIQNISFVLATIKAVVRDAEIQRLSNDPAAGYFEELRNIAYELEDILEEWRTEALRSEIKESQGSSSRKRKASSFLSATSSWVSDAFYRHNIGKKIKENIENLESISKMREILNLEVDTEARERVEKKHREDTTKKRETSSLVNTWSIVGREGDKDELVKLLLTVTLPDLNEMPVIFDENEVPVISIVGMGGVGKTTLAQIVYNDKEVMAQFEKRMWVCISDDFDVKRITISILKSANEMGCESMELDQSQNRLSNILHQKRFLLVLDDVWSQDTESWDRLCPPFQSGALGSRIIITTRSKNVAWAMRNAHMHKLGVLSYKDCWSLFHRRALVQRTAEECELLEPIGRKIVKKCGGVPLAAKTLGSAMSSKRTRREWELVLESETWNSHVALPGILPALLLSYYDLPSDIKQCFIYCSLYPKDWLIEKDEIVKLWVAQGFIHSDVSGEMEEIAGLYFDDLLSRSLLQEHNMDYVRRYGGTVRCKMHDLVHDLARFISKDEYSIVEIGRQTPDLSKARHCFLRLDARERSILDVIRNAKMLRTLYLVVQPCAYGWVVPDTLFDQLRCLRSLHLKDCNIKELSPDIGMLKHLRYLNLSYNRSLVKLPETVSNLCNLQTLTLYLCNIKELPPDIGRLKHLRHLDLTGNRELLKLPETVSNLCNLQALELNQCNIEELPPAIGMLKHLRHLDLTYNKELVKLPETVSNLCNLQTLKLHNCNIKELPPDIGRLKHLRYLDLSWNRSLVKLPETVSNLCNLQTLDLNWCTALCELPHGMSQMTNLRHLKIERTDGLRYLPQGMERLRGLRTLDKFIVGGGDGKGCDLRELKDLNLLQGRLHIENLEYVSGYDEAREAELDKKKGLRFLRLEWHKWPERELDDLVTDENHLKQMDDIAEALRPSHINLEELTVHCYEGSNFPNWMMDPLFSNLVKVTLYSSRNCMQLPGLGQLLSLKCLEINGMDKVRHIGSEFCGSSSDVSFPKLEKLSFDNMPNWEEWELLISGRRLMPSLCQLYLYNCPKLKKFLPNSHLLSLETLGLWSVNNKLLSEGLLPTLPNLNHLTIDDCKELTSIASGWLGQLKALAFLKISGCYKLSCLPEELQYLTKLRKLNIDCCPKLSCLPEKLPSLQTLKIDCCPKLSCLPEKLPSLQTLEVVGCLELVRRRVGGPQLEDRCKEGGEEWHKISHIPNIIINGVRL